MVVNYNGLKELQNKLRSAVNVKSTSVALVVRKNLMAVEEKLNNISMEIEEKQLVLLEKHAAERSEIDVVNEKMDALHNALRDKSGQVNEETFNNSMEAILAAHPSVRPFFDENKELIDGILNSEMILDDMDKFTVGSLPDNLSVNDLFVLGFLIEDLD